MYLDGGVQLANRTLAAACEMVAHVARIRRALTAGCEPWRLVIFGVKLIVLRREILQAYWDKLEASERQRRIAGHDRPPREKGLPLLFAQALRKRGEDWTYWAVQFTDTDNDGAGIDGWRFRATQTAGKPAIEICRMSDESRRVVLVESVRTRFARRCDT